MNRFSIRVLLGLIFCSFLNSAPARAADPDLPITVERPLRYHPDGTDFVIDNGQHWFNRPLYGPHDAFHTDGGDKPEFALIATAIKDGVLRLGLTSDKGEKWLTDADHITTRYRPGSLIYDIRDPLLADSTLQVTAITNPDAQGLLIRATLSNPSTQVKLVWIVGGLTSLRRGPGVVAAGDVITTTNVSSVRAIDEINGRDLKSQLMLTPQQCGGDTVTVNGTLFTIRSGPEWISGRASGGQLAVRDAEKIESPRDLFSSGGGERRLAAGTAELDQPFYLGLWRQSEGTADLAGLFEAAETHRQVLARTVRVDTPDPYVNAAVGALCVGADACWQPPIWVHGAVSWRIPLLGWRGPYIGDALGWHDRAEAYFNYWAGRQNVSDDFPTVARPNPARGLAENDGGMLHSNGSIPQSHYDMNLVYIDALFRHLFWTGDVDLARRMWPVIQRHLAWEKRCFDRDGLYEGYACIWASDALQYNGGGATHSTAYNEFHNRMAARVARWIGQDPTPYEQEADRIHQALQQRLWLPDRGWYAEYLDTMGEKQLHPSAALWSIYHAIDSRVPDPFQAWQSLRYVDTRIAHIPVRGPGVPPGAYHVLPESDWMPYEWSLNNVVTGENMHTALAYWEAGRPGAGFNLFKSTILDTMYLGMTPGNLPNLSAYDPYRGESYTDFCDPCGITSRALVEGLFGVQPDGIDGELRLRPGFPLEWDHARFDAHDLSYDFGLHNGTETWRVDCRFPRPMRLRLQLPARGEGVDAVTVNGQPAQWTNMDASIGSPWIEIAPAEAAGRYDVTVTWSGNAPAAAHVPPVVAQGAVFNVTLGPARLVDLFDPQKTLDNVQKSADSFTAAAVGVIGHRTAFAKVAQGAFSWWLPVEFEIRPPIEIVQSENHADDDFHFRIRNNTSSAIDGRVTIAYAGQEIQRQISVGSLTESDEISAYASTAPPGSTQFRVDLGGGLTAEQTLLNWQIHSPAGNKWDTVDLDGVFNDKVTQIFQNDYLSPRPQTCSLQMPIHGIGDWTGPSRSYRVSDRGLRHGDITLPQGVPFKAASTAEANNVAFTSQWDNYPRQIEVPVSGRASHAYFLLAGSAPAMESRVENGEIDVTYADGASQVLPLENPSNWWPIDKNYRIDDYAFRRPGPVPLRVALATGLAYLPEREANPAGGSATVLDLPLDPAKELKSVTLHTHSYELVIGMMALTLERQ